MKNFRVLLLALGTIFVSTQQAQASVKDLTGKLTSLQEKLHALSKALQPTDDMIQNQAKTMNQEEAKQAYLKSIITFPVLIKAINDAKDENATIHPRNNLFNEQKKSLFYMEAYLKKSNGDEKAILYMLNEAIKWAVVAEAAWAQAGNGYFGASPTKHANGKAYRDLVYKRFSEALEMLPKETIESLQTEFTTKKKWEIPGLVDGIAYVSKNGKNEEQRYLESSAGNKKEGEAADKAQSALKDLIKADLQAKSKKA